MRRLATATIVIAALGVGADASAQAPPSAPKPSDPNPAADPPALMRPLQLSLVAPDFVPGERYAPGCEENATTTGNSAGPWGNGLPWIRSQAFQLSPRLSVLAFARHGCPITAGVGAIATYTAPITSRVAFALSGGAYGMPQILDRGWAYKGLLRAGFAWRRDDGAVVHTGVEAMTIRGTSSGQRLGVVYGFSF